MGGGLLVLVAALTTWLAARELGTLRCDAAFEAQDWERVAAECHDAQWSDRQGLARAWMEWNQHRWQEALAIADPLIDANLSVAADAAYLAGYIRTSKGKDVAQGRAQLLGAFAGYQFTGRHAEAARAASFWSRSLRNEGRFDDELYVARLAADEAVRSGDVQAAWYAVLNLAESYDWIGMQVEASESFLKVERLVVSRPAELAWAYFKHAEFLIDIGKPQGLKTSLQLLDSAVARRDQANSIGLGDKVADLEFSIRLNRADALSQQGRLDAADSELAAAEHELGTSPSRKELTKVRVVKGYVAARRHDLGSAEALFAQADNETLDDDYRWRMLLELARLHRDAGHPADAKSAYHAAIKIIEQMRRTADVIELRPWVLQRRASPYNELFALLIDQGRSDDALVVAESLHARAWLDVALFRDTGDTTTAALAATVARIQKSLGAAPPLDRPTLMGLIGDHEVLAFFFIGAQIWRAHVAHGHVRFQQLTADAITAVDAFGKKPGDRAASERAASVLIPAELTASTEPLYVITNGSLANVLFAALRSHGRYLIEDRPVARMPGLAALRCPRSTWDDRVVLLGDPRGDLPDAAREVQRLAASFGGVAHVGPAATRAALRSGRGARLLHLAAHGIATEAGRVMTLADGNLTAADVIDDHLDPEVAVLAGCATAASDDAESWNGFPSAFLAAGSRYVVATLRSVQDAVEARIIEAYYAQPASLNPIERLAAAQREVAGELPVEAWASFTAWGNATCSDHSTATN